MAEFYMAEKLTKTITAIRSKTGEIMYLIEGANKAALIDTCLGVGNLREFVSRLTKKPLMVIVTHGHVDHAMGTPEFEEVYMNHKDEQLYMDMSELDVRKDYIATVSNKQITNFDELNFVSPAPMDFHNLAEGDSFDLGGINNLSLIHI